MSQALPKKKYSNFVVALLLLFPILINSVKIFGNLILLILAVLGVYIIATEKKNPFQLPELKLLSWLTTGYFLIMLLSMLYADGWNAEFHHLGRKLHFLLVPLIALTILQVDLTLKKILLSLKLGLIIIGLITISQFLMGHPRPSGVINQNIFGDIAVIMLLLSTIQIFIETPKERMLTIIAVLFGVSAIFLSASRGSWLSLVVLFIIYINAVYKPYLKNYKNRKVFLALALSFLSIFFGTQTNVSEKVTQAISEIEQWHSGIESYTSAGLRMEMWKSGLKAASQSPWLGYGYRNANQVVSKYALNHQRTIKAFTHLHNEYMTNLVSAGIIGLFMLLLLLFLPATIFYRGLKNKNTYFYSLAGILLCAGYATFGLSHIAFGEEHINAFYVLFISLLLPKVINP